MICALIMNLIPDPQRSEEEKLATGQMPSQYPSDDEPHGKGPQRNPSPPRRNYTTYGYQQDNAAPRHKTNMPPPKYKTFEIPKGGIVIRDNDGKRG
jgi:hypothetical protein